MQHRVALAVVDERGGSSYGVTHTSDRVWRTCRGSSPVRIEVWSNTNRPNPHPGKIRYGQCGPIGGDGKYLDPRNKGTDDEVTVLLCPESTIIDAYGTGTGTAASGQVWAEQAGPIASGDVLVLVYPDGREESRTVELTDGYGHGRTVLCPDPQ